MTAAPYETFQELLTQCEVNQVPISNIALQREAAKSGRSPESIKHSMAELLIQMDQTITTGISSETPSISGLSGQQAKKVMGLLSDPEALFPPIGIRMMAYGLATLEENSRMHKIVACPTAGGSGSVPAVLIAIAHERSIPLPELVPGLLTAGCIGELVARRMRLSGSAAGCQAEVGVASGMAAGAMVEVLGGTPQQVIHAAALSMQNLMGLVCDPVAGLVEVPCVVRNGLSGLQAAGSATMALAGIESFIPLDEVVDAMAEVGRLMSPKLKESAEGGLAKTPTGEKFSQDFFTPSSSKPLP